MTPKPPVKGSGGASPGPINQSGQGNVSNGNKRRSNVYFGDKQLARRVQEVIISTAISTLCCEFLYSNFPGILQNRHRIVSSSKYKKLSSKPLMLTFRCLC